ncbi:MAG: Gfo/Idh/MocA family oxidoreductase [Gemmatimonadota bacterium]
MQRVKIFGAGSIGNHLAHASRRLGWEVVVCDVDPRALTRMRDQIYPQRYGAWDDGITLCHNKDAPQGGFDLIAIGTPPDSHLPLALTALHEEPRAILIEKPLCPPSLEHAQEVYDAASESHTHVFVGYDHVVGAASAAVEELLRTNVVGEIVTLDVEFREHWGGIFAAHFWLGGPQDSYLGSWRAGGGASGEHSHALNLWQHFAHVLGAGRVREVSALLHYVEAGGHEYDDQCFIQLRTDNGFTGRVVQDVVTKPHSKRARLQGTNGAVEWVVGYNTAGDAVLILRPGVQTEILQIPKKRPDDFVRELEHIRDAVTSGHNESPITLERGLETMLVVAGVHLSEQMGSVVTIDYSKGFLPTALITNDHEPLPMGNINEPGV